MTTTRLVAASLAALLCALPAWAQTRAKITIGKDTTRILGPLRPDGTVDYLAAVNQGASKGVTKENNAAVGMLEALGPEILNEKIRDRALKVLGVALPPEGAYFRRYEPKDEADGSTHRQALQNPWSPEDHPGLLKWLKANRKPLAALIGASRRPRYYMPLLSISERPTMLTAALPNLGPLRRASRALAIRANLAIGQERADDAWRDILAIHRLGALLGQGPTVVERLVGIGICAIADNVTINLATSGKLSGPEARAILADLDAVGAGPGVIPAIDTGERFMNLDAVQTVAVDPTGLGKILEAGGKTPHPEAPIHSIDCTDVDFNDILRRVNFYFDFMVAGMRRPTHAEQVKAREALEAGMRKTMSLARNLADDKPVGSESVKTRRVGTIVLALLLPRLGPAQALVEQLRTHYHVARLAVALAAHRAEKGGYPATLANLAPTYVKSIPQDFFSGKDLIYKRRRAGYLLYSVGRNARDDGGVWDKPKGDDLAAKADR